jgi:predicted dithiol-disulfide oxidoreductase (DUF899 family)
MIGTREEVLDARQQLLDRTPKGRGEALGGWPRRHDEYEEAIHAG